MNIVALVLSAGLITSLVGAYVAVRMVKPQREGLYISTAEGATRILNSAMSALEKDLERKTVQLERKDAIIEHQEKQIEALELKLTETAAVKRQDAETGLRGIGGEAAT